MADDLRAIAFYLPQYHPIPENDAWWGQGFTEWTKVVDAKPLFHGHHQPQLPGPFGFYDLRISEVREAQAQLARQYGIHGFCYYHYWFDGKRLLERPFTEVLASGQPTLPFCLCWANENWTRRWDGQSKEVLIAQNYSADGDRAMIRELIPAFKDPRYIRVRGMPLFLVYRAGELPDPRATARIWRDEAVAAGLPGLYLCRVESMVEAVLQQDPAQIGFDAACEFPPHGIRVTRPNIAMAGLEPDFAGFIYDYTEVARDFATRPTPTYRRFHGVMPSWDNTARTGRRASLAVNSSPQVYRAWLEMVVNRTRRDAPEGERLVFINAWNEWGEGCHLEPDRRYGLTWLEATRAALSGVAPKMAFDPTAESHLTIYREIDRLAGELGLEGVGPQVVLRELSALVRRYHTDLARRDDVITALNEKLAELTSSFEEQRAPSVAPQGTSSAPAESLAS
ncbi:MAG TPA: glycoside hydrolase family 99-like domain-containing protein [Steroidobacteraceae bacterium]|nr:glycoside hydrolase family 99-like domain-containing protein [Steroidobacteraceae bacterium]